MIVAEIETIAPRRPKMSYEDYLKFAGAEIMISLEQLPAEVKAAYQTLYEILTRRKS
jgi:hypothetical protein